MHPQTTMLELFLLLSCNIIFLMCHVKCYGSLTSSVLITLVANPVDASKAGVSVFAL